MLQCLHIFIGSQCLHIFIGSHQTDLSSGGFQRKKEVRQIYW
jgi:hypothetical protein